MKPLSIITSDSFTIHLQNNYQGSRRYNHLFSHKNNSNLLTKLNKNSGVVVKALPKGNNAKKSSKQDGDFRQSKIQKNSRVPNDGNSALAEKWSPSDELSSQSNGVLPDDGLVAKNTLSSPSRSAVLQACTVTSGLILALGLVIRQVSHIAFTEGLPVIDCSTEVSFRFELWHLELITGLVILISACRYLLLQMWPDFAESSEAANKQILSSLQPLDYMVVAFLPGFSEELLFRGALMPLFGLNWKSALVVAVIFGALHLGSGRKYSFAVWATVVGFAYGYATILSSSIIVPITSHALNNLIGGILWRYMPTLEEK